MQTCALASAHASRPTLGSPMRSGHPWFAAAQQVGVWVCAALLALVSCMAQAQPLRGWDEWKAAYVATDGRVTDTGPRHISHSEGQGFGLVLATAANDKATFERIWHWTQTNPVSYTHLDVYKRQAQGVAKRLMPAKRVA